MVTYPSMLAELSREALRDRLRIRLSGIATSPELLPDATRVLRNDSAMAASHDGANQINVDRKFMAGDTRMPSGVWKSLRPVAEICHASAAGNFRCR